MSFEFFQEVIGKLETLQETLNELRGAVKDELTRKHSAKVEEHANRERTNSLTHSS